MTDLREHRANLAAAHELMNNTFTRNGYEKHGGIYEIPGLARVVLARNPSESSSTPTHAALFGPDGFINSVEVYNVNDAERVLNLMEQFNSVIIDVK